MPPTKRGRKRKAPVVEPDLVGVIPEVVIVTNLEGKVSEEPLLDVELLEEWVPLEIVTMYDLVYFNNVSFFKSYEF